MKSQTTSNKSLEKLISEIPNNFSLKDLSRARVLDYKNLFARLKNNDKLINSYAVLVNLSIDSVKKTLLDYPDIELPIEKEISKFDNYKNKYNFLQYIYKEIHDFFKPKKLGQEEVDLNLAKQRIEDKDNLKLRLLYLNLQEFFLIFSSIDDIAVPHNFLAMKKLFFLKEPEKLLKINKANLLMDIFRLINNEKLALTQLPKKAEQKNPSPTTSALTISEILRESSARLQP